MLRLLEDFDYASIHDFYASHGFIKIWDSLRVGIQTTLLCYDMCIGITEEELTRWNEAREMIEKKIYEVIGERMV